MSNYDGGDYARKYWSEKLKRNPFDVFGNSQGWSFEVGEACVPVSEANAAIAQDKAYYEVRVREAERAAIGLDIGLKQAVSTATELQEDNMVVSKERDQLRAECDRLTGEWIKAKDEANVRRAENEKLLEQKRLLFEENGRLLKEKEAGLWDVNHPVRAQLAELQRRLDEAAKIIYKAKEMIHHATVLECFTPEGSTEMWANEVVRESLAFLAALKQKGEGKCT